MRLTEIKYLRNFHGPMLITVVLTYFGDSLRSLLPFSAIRKKNYNLILSTTIIVDIKYL